MPAPCPPSRRALLRGAMGVPLAFALTGCLGRAWDDLPRSRLTLLTGNRGGVFDRYGEALAGVLDSRLDGVGVTTRNTNASVVNVHQVAVGDTSLGFSLGDVAADAFRGTGSFPRPVAITALTRTYDSFVHLVVRSDSPIHEVGDLAGRRVGLGAEGSGTRVIAARVLAAAKVPRQRVHASADTLAASATALAEGRLDAFFFVSGLPNTAVADLARRTPIRLVDLGSVVPTMTATYGTEYTPGPVPASTYGLQEAVDTVSVKNYVIANPDLDEDVAYAVTRVMFEAQEAIDRRAPGIRQPNLGAAIFTSPLPLHPGAERYFRERHS